MTTKPDPLGVMPRYRHEELRIVDLAQAIARHANEGKFELNSEIEEHPDTIMAWVDELGELVQKRLEGRPNKALRKLMQSEKYKL